MQCTARRVTEMRASTNDAFKRVPASLLSDLLDPKNIKELDYLLEYYS